MKEQSFIWKQASSFIPRDIFECGQCFRWNVEEDGSYTGIVKNNVLNVKKVKDDIVFKGMLEDDIEELVKKYFDLERDYFKIKRELSNVDENMRTSILYGEGIRILNQDLWETILSFIISANNNIPRIKGIIERLCEQYGNEIKWEGKSFYTFPTPQQLKKVKTEDYRKLGAGFRDIRLYETVQKINNKEVDLKELEKNKDTAEVKEKLLTLAGVGPKVADCILLFSTLKRLEVFPIDVWIGRVMNELYILEEKKVSNKQIQEIAKEKFGDLAGLAQQYLFYWKREA